MPRWIRRTLRFAPASSLTFAATLALVALAAAVVAVACAVSGCGTARPGGGGGGGERRRAGAALPMGAGAARVASNVVRGDYAGSARCAACHREIHEAWQRSPMRRMTRLPVDGEVRAPFRGETFRFKEDSARLSSDGGARFVRLQSAAYGDHLYRVTRVIGGRTREDFAGVEIPSSSSSRELILPVSYFFETASYRLKGYSVMVGERPGLRAGGVWSETCVFCHNTVPLFDTLLGALHGPGAPGYQGEVVDRALPRARRWGLEITDEGGLRAALADEVSALGGEPLDGGGPPRAALGQAIRAMRARFGAEHFVELGVGCESCHGGARAHVEDPRRLPDFAPRAPFLRARPPDGWGEVTRAEWINRACARCHQVLFSRYPFTGEGAERRGGDPGGSHITSGEARDFLLGGCARQMSCVTCHDPHGADRPEGLARLGSAAGNAVCARCHAELAAPGALRAHAHHDPAGAGASCLGCHMPRKNMGLGYALTRYHRIGSPTERARVEGDRPLECALCHADRSVEDLVGTMERWWGKRYDRAALRALYGDLAARPLPATLARGKAHEQAVAVAVLGEARAREALPAIARQLVNPFPLVRYYARKAVGQIAGRPCDVDVERPVAEVAAAAKARCAVEASAGAASGESVAGGRARANEAPDED